MTNFPPPPKSPSLGDFAHLDMMYNAFSNSRFIRPWKKKKTKNPLWFLPSLQLLVSLFVWFVSIFERYILHICWKCMNLFHLFLGKDLVGLWSWCNIFMISLACSWFIASVRPWHFPLDLILQDLIPFSPLFSFFFTISVTYCHLTPELTKED